MISSDSMNLITKYEGLRLESYDDGTGVWTIGYGTTRNIRPGMKITKEQAYNFLMHDIRIIEAELNKLIYVQLRQNEFDALVSLVYNIGINAFKHSTMLKYIENSNFDKAANEFERWVYADGRKLQGLVNRRAAEKELFIGG